MRVLLSVFSGLLLVVLGAGLYADEPPDVYVRADSGHTARVQTGTYQWQRGFKGLVISCGQPPYQFTYDEESTVTVPPGGWLTISNRQKTQFASYQTVQADWYREPDTSDPDQERTPADSQTLSMGAKAVTAPSQAGTYILALDLSYTRGNAAYGVKVVVQD